MYIYIYIHIGIHIPLSIDVYTYIYIYTYLHTYISWPPTGSYKENPASDMIKAAGDSRALATEKSTGNSWHASTANPY